VRLAGDGASGDGSGDGASGELDGPAEPSEPAQPSEPVEPRDPGCGDGLPKTTATNRVISTDDPESAFLLRDGPSADCDDIARLPNGSLVQEWGRFNEWAFITYSGNDGWVSTAAFDAAPTPEPLCDQRLPRTNGEPFVIRTNNPDSGFFLRTGPSGSCPDIDFLRNGTEVTRWGTDGNWSYVTGPTATGWVASAGVGAPDTDSPAPPGGEPGPPPTQPPPEVRPPTEPPAVACRSVQGDGFVDNDSLLGRSIDNLGFVAMPELELGERWFLGVDKSNTRFGSLPENVFNDLATMLGEPVVRALYFDSGISATNPLYLSIRDDVPQLDPGDRALIWLINAELRDGAGSFDNGDLGSSAAGWVDTGFRVEVCRAGASPDPSGALWVQCGGRLRVTGSFVSADGSCPVEAGLV